jgi:transcriptional regulator with XRE-family HTH domain
MTSQVASRSRRVMAEQRGANAVDHHIGSTVRERRLEIGMSQEALADLIGVTFQQVQKYEKGVNRIAASRLYEVSKALGVSISYFFEDLSEGAGKKRRGLRSD